jgi:PAS domain S-box-containing protein
MSGPLDLQLCRTILETLPTALYVVDRERRILLWNGHAEALSGYFRHEVIGRCCSDNILVHCNKHGTVLCGDACPLAGTMHDGRPRQVEVYMRHKMGHRVPVRVQSVVVRNENGSIVGAVEVFEQLAAMPGRVHDRASMETLLNAQFVDFKTRHIPFGVLLIEIEGMRRVDVMYGRPAEHGIVTELTDTLARCMRPEDQLGWWYENRLLAIVPNCWSAALADMTETLQDLMAQTAVPWWGDRLQAVVKVRSTDVWEDDSAESLLARCEAALEV